MHDYILPQNDSEMTMSDVVLNTLEDFHSLLSASFDNNKVVKLLLSKYRGEDKTLNRVTIRPITLQGETVQSFVYEHQTNHIHSQESQQPSQKRIEGIQLSFYQQTKHLPKRGRATVQKDNLIVPLEHHW